MEPRSDDRLKRRTLSTLHYLLLVGGALLLVGASARTAPLMTALALPAGWLQYSWFRAAHRRMHRPGHTLSRGTLAHFHRGHHADTGCNFGVTTPVWDHLFGSRHVATRDRPGDGH